MTLFCNVNSHDSHTITPTESTALSSTHSNSDSVNTKNNNSNDIINKYEHLISSLTAQALAQQEEITQLKETLFTVVGVKNDVNTNMNDSTSPITRDCFSLQEKEEKSSQLLNSRNVIVNNSSQLSNINHNNNNEIFKTRRMSKKWQHRVKDHTLGVLETYIRYVDERLASNIVERFRRVTREHVIRSVDKEILRVLQDKEEKYISLVKQQQQEQQKQKQKQEEEEKEEKNKIQKSINYISSQPIEVKDNYILNVNKATSTHVNPSSSSLSLQNYNNSNNYHTFIKEDINNSVSSLTTTSIKQPPLTVGTANITEPYVSSISPDGPSLSTSCTSFLNNHDHLLLEQLQNKVAMLEGRLTSIVNSSISKSSLLSPSQQQKQKPSLHYINESYSSLLSPPRVEATSDRNNNNNNNNNNSHRYSSSWSPTNSNSATNVSDDIEVLVDIFEGRQPAKVIQRLFN